MPGPVLKNPSDAPALWLRRARRTTRADAGALATSRATICSIERLIVGALPCAPPSAAVSGSGTSAIMAASSPARGRIPRHELILSVTMPPLDAFTREFRSRSADAPSAEYTRKRNRWSRPSLNGHASGAHRTQAGRPLVPETPWERTPPRVAGPSKRTLVPTSWNFSGTRRCPACGCRQPNRWCKIRQ
jgi:hypothetical protein